MEGCAVEEVWTGICKRCVDWRRLQLLRSLWLLLIVTH